MKAEELLAMLTPEILKKERPDLCEALVGEPAAKLKQIESERAAEALSAHKAKLMAEAGKVVSESKMPEKVVARITESLGAVVVTMESKSLVDEATKLVAKEKEYIESVAGPKVFGNGGGEQKQVTAEEALDALFVETK